MIATRPPFALIVGIVVAAPVFAAEPARLDAHGDPLPDGAIARLGTVRFRLPAFTLAVELSPDGKLLAVTEQQGVRLLDAASGKEVRRLTAGERGGFFVRAAARFSPDGKTLVVVTDVGGGVAIFDVATGKLLANLEIESRTGAAPVSFSADGKFLAVGAEDFRQQKLSVSVKEVATKKTVRTFEVNWDRRVQVALSDDGKILAAWGQSLRNQEAPTVRLWDLASGKELHTIKADGWMVGAAAFSPDGKQILTADRDSMVNVWDVGTGERLRRFAACRGTGAVLRFSPDGKLLVTGTHDGTLQLWDTATGKRLGQCKGPGDAMASVAFLGGSRVLAAGHLGQAVCLWDVPSGQELTPHGGHVSTLETLAFSRDGKVLLTGSAEGVLAWDMADHKEVRRIRAELEEPFRRHRDVSYRLSPDGRFLFWSAQNGTGGSGIIDTVSGQEIAGMETLTDYRRGSTCTAFAHGGSLFAALGLNQSGRAQELQTQVWDLESGLEVRTIKVAEGQLMMGQALAVSPDGKTLAVVTASQRGDGTEAALWDIATGKQRIALAAGSAFAMSFSPDGTLLATAGNDGVIRLWDATTGAAVRTLEGAKGGIMGTLAFSADGRTLAVVATTARRGGQGSAVCLWELASGRIRSTFDGHANGATALAFSPDGRILATGGADTAVLLWDLTGTLRLDEKARTKPTAEDVSALWADLNQPDAAQALKAMARLTLAPDETLALIRKELKPATGKMLAEKDVEGLLTKLEDEDFEVREKASKELAQAGRAIRPFLLKALASDLAPEKARRVKDLLNSMVLSAPPPEMMRPTRALELLERMGTPEAGRLLQTLAAGHPGAQLTADAAGALRRLAKAP